MRSAREHELPISRAARRAVLVVDDQPANLTAIREVLAPTGVEVVCVESGQEALRVVLARDFAVILLDLRMAPMTGLETARLLRTRDRSRRVPLVFVTAADVTPEEIRSAYDAGAADFLTKPLVPEILRAKVNVFVELHEAREELREQEARRRAAEVEALSIQDLTERKRLEQALRESEARSRSIVETLAEGVLIVDEAGTIIQANASAGRILRVPADAVIGRSIHTDDWSAIREDGSEFPHPDHPARVALRTGAPQQAVVMGLRMLGGRTLWLLLNAQPLRADGDGRIRSVVLSFFDITERREAELARRHTDDLLHTLVDAMPLLVSYVSYDGVEPRYELNNLTYEKWLGVDRRTTTGRTMREVLGDPAYEAIRPHVETALRGEVVRYQRELPYRTGPRTVEATYIPHRAADGKVIGFVVMVQDIGDRLRAEKDRGDLLRREREATARLGLVARTSRVLSDVSLRTDDVFRLVAETLTESFASFCGIFALEEDDALTPRGVSHRDADTARSLRMLATSARFRAPRPEFRVLLERGELISLGPEAIPALRAQLPEPMRSFLDAHPVGELVYAPLRVGTGFIGMLAIGRGAGDGPFDDEDRLLIQDLAERAALALEASRLYDEEKKAKEAALLRADFEERFIGIVSHDIRSPVTALKMASLLLRRAGVPPAASTQLDRIDRCARRVEQITALLLDFTRARIGSGIQIEPQPVWLGELCAKAVEEQLLAHPEQRIRCEGEAHVEADPGRITQALVNLVENAVKYGLQDGEIIVRAVPLPDGGASVSVHNRGAPIGREHISSLFQPFARGAQTEQTVKLSLGLGLFIVREIARAHGGDVGVVSSPEHGTTFTLTLPAKAAPPEPARSR